MATRTVGTLEAKTNLSGLLAAVERGERILITRHGKPIAELRPVRQRKRRIKAGFARGTFIDIAPDFDAPLSDFDEYMP